MDLVVPASPFFPFRKIAKNRADAFEGQPSLEIIDNLKQQKHKPKASPKNQFVKLTNRK